MSATDTASRARSLEELRASLHAMLAANRRLRSRESRNPGTIGFVHYRLLGALRREGRLTTSALAAASELSPATVTEMLDALVAAGLVERQRDGDDRRVVRIALTPRGRSRYDAKQARFVAALSEDLADLGDEAITDAAVVIERLAAFFDRM